jgi:predicted alpha/beta-hydrolase family hydrolase
MGVRTAQVQAPAIARPVVTPVEKFEVILGGGGRVTALTYAAQRKTGVLVLAHGAGANQSHPFMVRVASGLAQRGIETTTFNFLYTEEGRRAPDPTPKLEACFRDVIGAVRARGSSDADRLFLGGKSMGGRMASHLAAQGERGLRGLVFLGYPLHPPGKPEQLRSEHLARIDIPMLFVQGTRDPFGTPLELRPVLEGLGGTAQVFPVELGDHSFNVPKRSGLTEDVIMTSVLDRVAGFCR